MKLLEHISEDKGILQWNREEECTAGLGLEVGIAHALMGLSKHDAGQCGEPQLPPSSCPSPQRPYASLHLERPDDGDAE